MTGWRTLPRQESAEVHTDTDTDTGCTGSLLSPPSQIQVQQHLRLLRVVLLEHAQVFHQVVTGRRAVPPLHLAHIDRGFRLPICSNSMAVSAILVSSSSSVIGFRLPAAS